jgi:hypothetical protein
MKAMSKDNQINIAVTYLSLPATFNRDQYLRVRLKHIQVTHPRILQQRIHYQYKMLYSTDPRCHVRQFDANREAD